MKNTLNNDVVVTAHPFAGLKNGSERLAKVKLAKQINDHIKNRNLKQTEAAALLGITQPEVSQLANGRLSGFTFDRLYRCLQALDMDIEIVIRPHLAKNHLAGIAVSV